MKTVDNVPVVFVNQLLGRGVLNGVVNLTFGVLEFTPDENVPSGVNQDMVVAARLRMDLEAARGLYLSLGELLGVILQETAVNVPLPGEQPGEETSAEKAN